MTEQIKDYLLKYNIKSEEDLAKHIEELKRNTVPNNELIFPLVEVLLNEKAALSSFFRENIINNSSDWVDIRHHFAAKWCEIKHLYDISVIGKRKLSVLESNFYNTYGDIIEIIRAETDEDLNKILCNIKMRDTEQELTSEEHIEEQLVFNEGCLMSQEFGKKETENKLPMSILFKQFPDALKAIVKCSEYGHKKYSDTDQDYLNFRRIKGGSKAYADAGLRHRLEIGDDLESYLPHPYHIAWNALAELQLWIEETTLNKS